MLTRVLCLPGLRSGFCSIAATGLHENIVFNGSGLHNRRPHSTSTAAAAAQQATPLEPDVAELQQQLLEAAMRHVQRLGWTRSTLAAAAAELQLSPACVGMFPRGAAHLVEHHIASCNAALAAELAAAQQQCMALPVRQRITAAVRRRLEMNAPYLDDWPQALALLAQPGSSPAALRLLAQLLDTIWYAAGDTSTDASWYTKRAALAAVYSTTELYMLTDFSPGYADTWQQLERRVDDVMWLGSTAAGVAALPQQLLSSFLHQVRAHTQQPSQPQQPQAMATQQAEVPAEQVEAAVAAAAAAAEGDSRPSAAALPHQP